MATHNKKDNSGLFDKDVLFFLGAVAVAIIAMFKPNIDGVLLITAVVVLVLSELYVSYRFHSNKLVRTLISVFISTWFFLMFRNVVNA